MKVLYPPDFKPYHRILCADQLNRQLESNQVGLKNPFQLRSKIKGSKFLDFACKTPLCTAFMNYQLNDDNFYELTEASNSHNHPICEKSTKVVIVKNSKRIVKTISSIKYDMNSLYVTKEMLIYYKKYHRCMYITITKVKNYYMLAFTCTLPTKDVGIFALALYEKPTTNLVTQSLRQFVNRRNEFPQTIICNNQQVSELSKQFFPSATFIMIDQEISQSYKVRYGFTRLTQIVTYHTDWEKQHRKLVTYIRDCVSPVEICTIFENYKKLCFPFLPLTFVGLGVQLFQSLILQQTCEENIYFTDGLNKFLANFPHKIKTSFQDTQTKTFIEQVGISSNNLLLDVYTELQEPVVKFLVNQQNKTFFCDLQVQPCGQFQVKYKLNKVSRVSQKQKKWECDCGLYIKTGLPCCHVMKVLLILEEQIRPYISEYWLPPREPKQVLETECMMKA